MESSITNDRKSELLQFDKIRTVSEDCHPFYVTFFKLEQKKENIKNSCAKLMPIRNLLGIVSLFCFIGSLTEPSVLLKWALLSCAAAVLLTFFLSSKRGQAMEQIKEIKAKQQEALNEITDIYSASSLEDIYPLKYLYTDAVDYCYNAIFNMRVSSIPDALKLYEDEEYKPKINAMTQSTESVHRAMAERINKLERKSADLETSARLAAMLDNVGEEEYETQSQFAAIWPKISIGTITLLAGFGALIYGNRLNDSYEAQLNSIFNSGTTNPGDIFVYIGYALIVVGVLSILYNFFNAKKQ